jgi:AcrR family transcriptional regulator
VSVRSQARRPALRERAREAVATAILDAAEDVALQRGVDATSIAAIAERAGVAVGTLYNYFPDRDALLAALFKHRVEQIKPQLQEVAVAARGLAFEQRLRAVVTGAFEVFERHRRFCALAMSDPGRALKTPKPVLQPTLVTALVDVLRPVSGTAGLEHAHMIYGAIKEMLALRVSRGEPLPPAGPVVVDAFLHGIRARKKS